MTKAADGEAGGSRPDVRREVARRVIEAMERGGAPWQKPWVAGAMRPMNLVTGNAYRGINRALLGIASDGGSNLFMTYRQAQERGWQVRAGEKGTMIVKVVELGRGEVAATPEPGDETLEGPRGGSRALRRYFVFNAGQVDGIPRELTQREEPTFDRVDRAEGVMRALMERTGLSVAHGFEPCYMPQLDLVRLPFPESFNGSGASGYHSVALHEAAHSTLHARRLNRSEALGKRWGDQAYALEELRAEICSAILAAETGVAMSEASIANHAAYLNSWVKAIEDDPMAIFTAAKDADLMAEYLLGLEAQLRAEKSNEAWVRDYELAEQQARSR